MKHFKSVVLTACAVVVAAALTLPSAPVSAQTSASLSIAPKKNYLIEPGKSVKDKLSIRNLDNTSPLELSLRIVDFTFTDDGGTPKLMMAPDAPQTTWSLKPYLTVPKTVSVPKGGSKTIDMSVAIPAGHGAGSFYSAIVYSTGAPDGGNVGLSASGVTLVFTQIPGKVNEDLKLEKFGSYVTAKEGKSAGYTFINVDEPLNIGYTLKNSGNVTEAPVGSIKLKPLFGKEIAINNVNPNSSLALIGQTRTYTTCIKLQSQEVDFNGTKTPSKTCVSPGLWPGYYSASLDLFYGQNGNVTKEIIGNSSFWYLPLWFIILLIVVLIILAYLIWRAQRFVRSKLYGHSPRKRSSRRK